jgi:autoinducer 2-degrading protein
MYVACVTARVRPECVEQFIEASLENARNSRQEAENVRFDVLQAEDDPARFFLYEVYRTKEGSAAHKRTAHYLKWRATVAEWMAEPRAGVTHYSLFPDESGW